MDTSLMSFVLPARYIKEGKIYQIYFICQNGNLELYVDGDAGRILLKREHIFSGTFSVEGYLTEFFSLRGGRIEYQSESSLEEDIKQMISNYDQVTNSRTWGHLEWDDGRDPRIIDCSSHTHGGDSIADMITNSYRDMMNGATMRTLEQMVAERREEIFGEQEDREENEDRR